jgi:hypothetical protein
MMVPARFPDGGTTTSATTVMAAGSMFRTRNVGTIDVSRLELFGVWCCERFKKDEESAEQLEHLVCKPLTFLGLMFFRCWPSNGTKNEQTSMP